MGRFVIVAYAPKPGKAEQLMAAVRKHMEVLCGKTDHTPARLCDAGQGWDDCGSVRMAIRRGHRSCPHQSCRACLVGRPSSVRLAKSSRSIASLSASKCLLNLKRWDSN